MRLPFSEYRSLVGSMLYLAVTSRPDISFAVCQLSRVMSNPSKAHWNELLVLLRYLSGTRTKGTVYRRDGPPSSSSSDLQEEQERVRMVESLENRLITFVDSDYARDPATRRSIAGYIVFMNGGSVA